MSIKLPMGSERPELMYHDAENSRIGIAKITPVSVDRAFGPGQNSPRMKQAPGGFSGDMMKPAGYGGMRRGRGKGERA